MTSILKFLWQNAFLRFLFSAVGAGAVKSNMTVLAAEQVPVTKITSHYFDKFVVVVSIGILIAVLVVPFIQDKIPPEYHYILYLVALCMIFVASSLFLIGWRYYLHVKTEETVITHCIPVIVNAFQTWYKSKRKDSLFARKNTSSIALRTLNSYNSYSAEDQAEPTKILKRPLTFLDFAKIDNQGRFQSRIVDDVKTLPKALLVFTLLVPYWLICNQVKKIVTSTFSQNFVLFRLLLLFSHKDNIWECQQTLNILPLGCILEFK